MENNHTTTTTSKDPIDLSALSNYYHHWKQKSSLSAKEAKPSHLNTFNSSGLFQLVSPNKMSVQYVGAPHPQHGHDVGAVQADCPAPTRTLAYYFEMSVMNAGEKGAVAIGFTSPATTSGASRAGRPIVAGIMETMAISTTDMEMENLLAPNIQLETLLVLDLLKEWEACWNY